MALVSLTTTPQLVAFFYNWPAAMLLFALFGRQNLNLIIISIVYNENWKYYTILVHIEISVPFCKIVPNTCAISKVNYNIVLDIKPCLYSFSMSYIDSFLAGIRTKIFLHHIRTEKDVYSKQSLEQQKITEIYVYPTYFCIVKEFI